MGLQRTGVTGGKHEKKSVFVFLVAAIFVSLRGILVKMNCAISFFYLFFTKHKHNLFVVGVWRERFGLRPALPLTVLLQSLKMNV